MDRPENINRSAERQAGSARRSAGSYTSRYSGANARDIAFALGCRAQPDARGNFMCRCPGPLHRNGDKHPSLSVANGRNGKPVLFCFAGCTYDEIVRALEARGLRL